MHALQCLFAVNFFTPVRSTCYSMRARTLRVYSKVSRLKYAAKGSNILTFILCIRSIMVAVGKFFVSHGIVSLFYGLENDLLIVLTFLSLST